MGWQTAWFSEINPYASAVLKKHWPNIPNHGDITSIRGDAVEQVDMLVGGFPCQDISLAGTGAGITGSRSGLWEHYHRLIAEIRPRYVVAENVSALRSRGLDKVLREIAALGYDAEWHCIPAAYVGAPHRRDRIWITAWRPDSDSRRLSIERLAEYIEQQSTSRCQPDGLGSTGWGPREDMAHTNGAGCGERRRAITVSPQLDTTECSGQARSQWWLTEPDVGRVAHGVPKRVDRLRCLGNAIVPQVAHLIFQAIQARESGLSHI